MIICRIWYQKMNNYLMKKNQMKSIVLSYNNNFKLNRNKMKLNKSYNKKNLIIGKNYWRQNARISNRVFQNMKNLYMI